MHQSSSSSSNGKKNYSSLNSDESCTIILENENIENENLIYSKSIDDISKIIKIVPNGVLVDNIIDINANNNNNTDNNNINDNEINDSFSNNENDNISTNGIISNKNNSSNNDNDCNNNEDNNLSSRPLLSNTNYIIDSDKMNKTNSKNIENKQCKRRHDFNEVEKEVEAGMEFDEEPNNKKRKNRYGKKLNKNISNDTQKPGKRGKTNFQFNYETVNKFHDINFFFTIYF